MAKGEIAHYEQFLLLSLCFQKPSAAEASESVCMRERDRHACCSQKHVYQVSFEHVEHFFSYEVRYKFCENADNAAEDTDDDNAKVITIAQ